MKLLIYTYIQIISFLAHPFHFFLHTHEVFFLFFFKNIYCNSLKFPSFVKKSLLIQSFIELNRDQFVRSCEIEVSLHYTCFYAFSFVIIVCMLKQKKKKFRILVKVLRGRVRECCENSLCSPCFRVCGG